MKALCIRMNGSNWFFDYEEGNEEELLVAMLTQAQKPETPFEVTDIIEVVRNHPELFNPGS